MASLLLLSCTKNEVKVTFALPADDNTPCRIIYYISDKQGGVMREAVAEITAGKGEIILPERFPALFYIYGHSQKQTPVVFYAAKGAKIAVSGESQNVEEWDVKGNETTDSLSAWRLRNLKILREGDAAGINREVEKYVVAHRNSEAAAIILYVYYNRREDYRGFFTLRSKLAPEVLKDEMLADALSMADLMADAPEARKTFPDLILADEEGYADTISFGKGKKVMMMFRASLEDAREVKNDSIINLAERMKDHILAEVYMETDSLSWQRHVRNDTLQGVKRLWMPLGPADEAAAMMGVTRSPYYIVVDSLGHETYRGDDWEKAARQFEKKDKKTNKKAPTK